jgi:hypothetical protein
MLPRIEYSVTALATPEELCAAFCDLSRLLGRGIYSEAAWTEGLPWKVGSRLRYVVAQPVAATVTAVVTLFEPASKIGLLNHSSGVTVQQLVTFTPLKNGMTRVAIVMDSLGESTANPPIDVPDALGFFTKDSLDSMLARWKQKQESH